MTDCCAGYCKNTQVKDRTTQEKVDVHETSPPLK
jgi:hypothetical protein